MIHRRDFLGRGRAAVVAAAAPLVAEAADKVAGKSPEEAARDEDYWATVRQAFRLDGRFVDLQGNAVAAPPRTVQDELARTVEVVNSLPAYHLYHYGRTDKDRVRRRLAGLIHADPAEVALVRNTTEAMAIPLRGLALAAGDEVLTTEQDYPALVRLWRERAKREGFAVRTLDLPPAATDDEIVTRFEQAFTRRTKAVMACHVLMGSGRVLPVARLCGLARDRGAVSLIDGAHGFGLVPTDVRAIGCDYYGTSLHKWAFGPLGTGFLYVRRDRITGTWPLLPNWEHGGDSDRIEKFEDPGTLPAVWAAVNPALDLLDAVGPPRKQARHRHLTAYWAGHLAGVKGVTVRREPTLAYAGGFLPVAVAGVEPQALFRHLLDRHRILVGVGDEGVKIGAQVYTRPADLDAAVDVLKAVAAGGLPK